MEFSEEERPVKNDISDKIMTKVSTFPSMPRAGIKLRSGTCHQCAQVG